MISGTGKEVPMAGVDTVRAILERESLSPTKTSVEMGHGRAYLNTLLNEERDCKLSTVLEFLDTVGYEAIVRSRHDGFEFPLR